MLRFVRRFTRRRKPPAEPVYFTRLQRLSDDEWRAALSESPQTAAKWVYAAATAGDVDAQMTWAQMLLEGHGTKRDPDAAFRWFTIAATHRRADAVNMLGRCHERGWGTAVDLEKAAACYREAAGESDHWAMFNLASLMLDGRGIPQDHAGAFTWFTQAMQQGNIKALNMIGYCHEHGVGCPRDMIKATIWYRRSAEANDFRGQYRVAQLFLESGLPQEALPMLRRAIDNAPAAFRRCFADELMNAPEPHLRELGQYALTRSNQMVVPER